jgi:excisionase family DNA binding protein
VSQTVNAVDILTILELAARLKVSKHWVYSQMRAEVRAKGNPLPAIKMGGTVRFHWPDVSAWMLTQTKQIEKPKQRQFRRRKAVAR